jgi:hypothetical protein
MGSRPAPDSRVRSARPQGRWALLSAVRFGGVAAFGDRPASGQGVGSRRWERPVHGVVWLERGRADHGVRVAGVSTVAFMLCGETAGYRACSAIRGVAVRAPGGLVQQSHCQGDPLTCEYGRSCRSHMAVAGDVGHQSNPCCVFRNGDQMGGGVPGGTPGLRARQPDTITGGVYYLCEGTWVAPEGQCRRH